LNAPVSGEIVELIGGVLPVMLRDIFEAKRLEMCNATAERRGKGGDIGNGVSHQGPVAFALMFPSQGCGVVSAMAMWR